MMEPVFHSVEWWSEFFHLSREPRTQGSMVLRVLEAELGFPQKWTDQVWKNIRAGAAINTFFCLRGPIDDRHLMLLLMSSRTFRVNCVGTVVIADLYADDDGMLFRMEGIDVPAFEALSQRAEARLYRDFQWAAGWREHVLKLAEGNALPFPERDGPPGQKN